METISRAELNTLEDDALIEACVGPTVRRIMGRSLTDKMRLTGGLTSGQRALLMFRMVQGHCGGGTLALFRQLSYLLIHKGVWMGIKKGFGHFGNRALGQLAHRLEAAYLVIAADGLALTDWERDTSPAVSTMLEPLDRDLREQMPAYMKTVASSIRRRPDEYVRVVD